ncbi:MAG: hypothetical protein KDA61_23120 [Planctomycetales bacterium]|nr:hypothetical protein [Planctomycetales bacterium]
MPVGGASQRNGERTVAAGAALTSTSTSDGCGLGDIPTDRGAACSAEFLVATFSWAVAPSYGDFSGALPQATVKLPLRGT